MDYKKLKAVDFDHLWHPFTQYHTWREHEPLIVQQAEGVWLTDVQGCRYLDGISSLWCNVHGHSVPELVRALKEQADLVCHSTLLGLSHVPILELTEKLTQVLPKHLKRVFFSDSGSAAVEAAIRMAVEWWGKQSGESARKKRKLVSLVNGYHGDTLGSVGLGYLPEFHSQLAPIVLPSIKVNPPHIYRFYRGLNPQDALNESLKEIEELFRANGDEIAAFFLEPIVQGAAGMWTQPIEYGLRIGELCRQHDVLFIADEVATGFGKTGKMFAVEHGQLKPDILTMGKGLSAGYLPISAAAATEDIFQGFVGAPEEFKTFFFGQTFSGNPLAAHVACANLDYFASHNVLEQVSRRITYLERELEQKILPLPNVDEIRSFGLMTGIELTAKEGERKPFPIEEQAGLRVVYEARKRGVVIRPLGNVMVLMPALAMSEPEIAILVDTTADAINAAFGG